MDIARMVPPLKVRLARLRKWWKTVQKPGNLVYFVAGALLLLVLKSLSSTPGYLHVDTKSIALDLQSSGKGKIGLLPARKDLEIFSVKVNGAAMVRLEGATGGGLRWRSSWPNLDAVTGKRLQPLEVVVQARAISPLALEVVWEVVGGVQGPGPVEEEAVPEFEVRVRDKPRAWYGGGERFNAVNQAGNILPMFSVDKTEGGTASRSYKPIPFVMSSTGWGLWVDSYARGTFFLNHPEHDTSALVLRYRETKLRLVFITGPKLLDVLAEFTRLTGRPKLPPAWSFAPWKGRDVHFNTSEVIADVVQSRKHGIPASVILIDSPWAFGYNDFELNTVQFQQPESMFDRMRQLGFYCIFWMTPFVNLANKADMVGIVEGRKTSTWDEAVSKGFLVKNKDGTPQVVSWWKGKGSRVDFSGKAAVEWWHGQLAKTKNWGDVARGFKVDDGEGNYFAESASFTDGSSLSTMRNRYMELYSSAMQSYIDRYLGGDGVQMARSAFTGSARSYVWAGDQRAMFDDDNGLGAVMRAGQTAAASGLFLWGSDIAGYFGKTIDKEVFIRWAQFGALSPLMHQFGQANNAPWDYDRQTIDIYRRFARLHMALFPYLRDAALRASESGHPIICPMGLCFQGDPTVEDEEWQYLFGPSLLVAPVRTTGGAVSVALPQGSTWVDFWTGAELQGGQTLEREVALAEAAIFVRGGALIPAIPEDTDTLVPRSKHLDSSVKTLTDLRILQVWPGALRSELTTSEGLTARLARSESRGDPKFYDVQLVLSTTKKKADLDIHIMFSSKVQVTLSTNHGAARESLSSCQPSLNLGRPVVACRISLSQGKAATVHFMEPNGAM